MALSFPLSRALLEFPEELTTKIAARDLAVMTEEEIKELMPSASGMRVHVISPVGRVALLEAPRMDSVVPLVLGRDAVRHLVPQARSVLCCGLDAEGLVRVVLVCDEDLLPEAYWLPLRSHSHTLDAATSTVTTRAYALWNWQSTTRFCVRCGGTMEPQGAGTTLACTACGHIEYPRQDMAMIVAIVDPSERLLLAHNTAWPTEVMSLIAGYVDAGESVERTVQREAREEAGIDVEAIEYLGTQPWPFPASHMIVYTAFCAQPDALRPDDKEIDRVRFFSREECEAEVAAGLLRLPHETTVARVVIDRWRAGSLHTAGTLRMEGHSA